MSTSNAPINKITHEDVEEFSFYPSFNHYQEIAVKSAIYPGQGTVMGLAYVALKLAGEAGEVAQCLGKAWRDDGAIAVSFEGGTIPSNAAPTYHYTLDVKDFTPERLAKFKHELGGVLWYLAAACRELNITLDEVARENLAQLASRTERGTLGGDGDDR